MGAGPGLMLVNPDPTDPTALATFMGLPKVYAWGVLWYAMEVVIVVTAYRKVWRDDEASETTVSAEGRKDD